MKTPRLILAALVAFVLTAGLALAADLVAAPAAPDAQNFVLTFLTNLIQSSPKVATLIGVLGTMRLWAKPAFSIVHSIVDMTPSTRDDALIGQAVNWFATSTTGRGIAYALDYLTSIKIVPIQPKSDLSPGTPRASVDLP